MTTNVFKVIKCLSDLDGEAPPLSPHYRSAKLSAETRLGEGRAHHNEGALRSMAGERKQEVNALTALMKFIEDERRKASELILRPEAERNTRSDKEERCFRAAPVIIADPIAHALSEGAPLKLRDPRRERSTSDPARLDHEHRPPRRREAPARDLR